jgi:hypothetical protein
VDFLEKVEVVDTDNKRAKEVLKAMREILEKKEIENKALAAKEYI